MSLVRVTAQDQRYEALSQGFNQRWIAKPDLVALVGSTQDVVDVVTEAVGRKQRISVRSGGHCYENFVCNDEVKVIVDLSGLDRVYWDADRSAYCVEAGATNWRMNNHLYRPYGVTLPGGSCYSVGAGGHICGGGFGLLSRQFGLTVDYLHAVEVVVIPDGKKAKSVIVCRDDSDNSADKELWWAHTGGGGGNFGVVTRYWFRDLPQPPKNVILSGAQFAWSDLLANEADGFTRLVRNFGNFFAKHSASSDPFADLFAILQLTHASKKELGMVVQLDATGQNSNAKLTEFYKTVLDGVTAKIAQYGLQVGEHAPIQPLTLQGRVMPWIQATQTLNSSGENRRGKYKSAYHRTAFTPHHIKAFRHHLTHGDYRNKEALVQVDSYGGNINKTVDTAVAQRDSVLKLQYQTYWTNPAEDEKHLKWIRDFYTDVYRHTGGVPAPGEHTDGCYIGYADVDISDPAWNTSKALWHTLYYKKHYPRLQKVKATWDPHDIFRHAQSIRLPHSSNNRR